MLKILAFDVETSGLSPEQGAEILQFAGILYTGESLLELQYKDSIELFFRPSKYPEGMDKALEVQSRTREQVEQYPGRLASFARLLEFLDHHVDRYDKQDKCYPLAFNGWFDYTFLADLFRSMDHKYFGSYVNHRLLDPLPLWRTLELLGKLPQVENRKLATIAAALGIPLTSAHDARADIIATYQVWRKLVDIINKKQTDPVLPLEHTTNYPQVQQFGPDNQMHNV